MALVDLVSSLPPFHQEFNLDRELHGAVLLAAVESAIADPEADSPPSERLEVPTLPTDTELRHQGSRRGEGLPAIL